MPTINLTPVPHAVFNEFDEQGLLLGLPRLSQEKNAAYKKRLFDVFVHKGGPTYRGLINAVTREVGLEIIEALKVEPVLETSDQGLTGTIDPTASISVIGVGTLFLTELVVGDRIIVNSEERKVATIIDNLNLTVTTAFTDTANDLTPLRVARNTPLVAEPGVTFQDTKLTLYSDYSAGTVLLEIDRFDPDGGSFTLAELKITVDATGFYLATIESGVDTDQRSMTVFNQSTIKEVLSESISEKGFDVRLLHQNLIEGTVAIKSQNLTRKVALETDLVRSGDYFINLEYGRLLTFGSSGLGSVIRYKYRDDDFLFESSPVIIHNLQREDYKTKMFEQVPDPAAILPDTNGKPTPRGANIINELLSVFPTNWSE